MSDPVGHRRLAGKVALITGGASGIGAATAELFASLGAAVIVADIADEAGAHVAARLGPPHRFLHLDVSDPKQWQGIAGQVPSLDILVLNAGVMTRPVSAPLFDDPLPWLTAEAFERLAAVNLGGVLFGLLAFMPHLKRQPGSTVLVTASVAGVRGYVPDPLYSMTKHGLIGLCTSLAPTLATDDIRIVAICPSGIETGMVPPDLHRKRTAERSFAPPSHMARSIVEIYERALPGEVWLGQSNRAPRRYVPAPVDDPAPPSPAA